MARTAITYNGFDLQDGTNYSVSEISHEDISGKKLNIQSFAIGYGGKLTSVDYEAKTIKVRGIVKGSSKSDLETKVDTLKRQLNSRERDLDIDYETETRRYVATMSAMSFGRKYYTIDTIEYEAVFTISDPPFGKSTDTNTLEQLGINDTSATTATMEAIGTLDFGGTVAPTPVVQITVNTALGVKAIEFENTDEDGHQSKTRINKSHYQDGDIIEIDLEAGTIQINGVDTDFTYGFPKFSLVNNSYTVSVIGEAYNIDVKFVYYKLWL